MTVSSASPLRDERSTSLLAGSSELILVLDEALAVSFCSPAASQLLGWEPAEVEGSDFVSRVHPEDRDAVLGLLNRVVTTGRTPVTFGCRISDRKGEWRDHEVRVSDDRDVPTVAGLVINARDVTEWRNLESQLTRQALRDPLTGLGNKALFEAQLARQLALQHRDDRRLAMLFIDLDHFKDVNDSLGHLAGDHLLHEIAQRLVTAVRDGDTVARLGGDEFAVLCEDADEETATGIAERVRAHISAPLTIDNRQFFASASIGVAVAGRGMSESELLRNADAALYAAKEAGRNRWAVYSDDLHESALARLEAHAELRRGLDRGEFWVAYQPIVDLASGQPVGAEALLRWNSGSRGPVSPADFIPLAEAGGFIIHLGREVLWEACAQAAHWKALGQPANVSVNLSARQLREGAVVEDVQRALGASGLPPQMLTLELTESAMLGDPDQTLRQLDELKRLGVRLAIDDFGTGYSSLAYLCELPVDTVKIDRSFVAHLPDSPQQIAVVRAVVEIGRTFGFGTVVEGVETVEQAAAARILGCGRAQGYLYGRPEAPKSLPRIHRARRLNGNANA